MPKLLPVVALSLAAGVGLGVALAYVEVGEVETAFAPPARPGDTPGPGAGPEAPTPSGPVAAVDGETFNFGVMQRGGSESHEFIVTNKGNAPLTVEVGRTSCKCTLGEVSKKPLAPGESTPVRLEWVAKSVPGDFRQVATLLTNDPRRPTVELTVEGTVTETAGLTPEEFLLGRVAADSESSATVYLASYDPDGGQVVAEAAMDPSVAQAERYRFAVEPVEVADLPFDKATSGVKITVTAGPGLPIGHITEWVTVKTNLHDGKPRGAAPEGDALQVPLLAVVQGDVSVHGANWIEERGLLNLGTVESGAGKQQKLRLSFKGEHAARLRASVVSADPEWLEVDLSDPVEVREGVWHQPMTVRVPPGRPPEVRSGEGAEAGGIGDGDARLRLATGHPTATELDVRVRFVITQ